MVRYVDTWFDLYELKKNVPSQNNNGTYDDVESIFAIPLKTNSPGEIV